MNLAPMLAELNFMSGGIITIAVVVIVIVLFLLVILVLSRYTKVGPNQVLIVSGRKHTFGGWFTGRVPHRQRRRHVRLSDPGKGGPPVARTADD